MKIRQASVTDSLLLSSLCVDVQTLHAKYHPNIFKMPQEEDFAASFFNETLADPTISIFLAEKDEQALGYVLCKLLERIDGPFTFALRYLLVDQISVRPIAQGKGIGKALLQRVEMLARELNIHRIQLDSWGFNLDAHMFFQKVGFEKFTHRFWKNL